MKLTTQKIASAPSFKRLVWVEKDKDATQYAIGEIMRADKDNNGALSFDVLKNQFDEINETEEDVFVNCTCSGTGENGIFSVYARNIKGNVLADSLVFLTGTKGKGNDEISGFAQKVKAKLFEIKNARALNDEQKKFNESAGEYMKKFDTRA